MSLSSSCEGCPFNSGFEVEPDKILMVCGDPPQVCIDKRQKLLDQVAAWNRMASTAETAKNGILNFEQLTLGDFLHITSQVPGSESTEPDREFRIQITDIQPDALIGTVIIDSYLESDDLNYRYYALTKGSDVMIFGAFEKEEEDGDEWDGTHIPGELHVSRFVEYASPDALRRSFGMFVHEIIVISEDESLCMTQFDANPSEMRPAPPLTQ